MDIKKVGLGVGVFVGGVAAFGLGLVALVPALARRGLRLDAGEGPVPGDSVTAPVAPKPADLAAAPVGMAETEKNFRERKGSAAAEHGAPDLAAGKDVGGERAPDAFRPDPTAVPSKDERDSLRPATGPAPTLIADEGSGFSEAAGAS